MAPPHGIDPGGGGGLLPRRVLPPGQAGSWACWLVFVAAVPSLPSHTAPKSRGVHQLRRRLVAGLRGVPSSTHSNAVTPTPANRPPTALPVHPDQGSFRTYARLTGACDPPAALGVEMSAGLQEGLPGPGALLDKGRSADPVAVDTAQLGSPRVMLHERTRGMCSPPPPLLCAQAG